VTALTWAFGEQFARQVLQFVFAIILARLLTPEDFGIIAMVTVFTRFAMILNNYGFSNALIQKKDVTKSEIDTVFWFNLFIGVIFFYLFFISSNLIAEFYTNKSLALITKVIAVGFILQPLSSLPFTILSKNLEFKKLGIISLISFSIASLTAIVLTLMGFGYWALVVRSLLEISVAIILLTILTGYYPTSFFKYGELYNFMNFALNLTGNSIITYWMRNFDNLLIGKMLGQYSLGLYNRSYNIMLYPLNNLTNVVRKVMFTSFSSIQNQPERIKKIYLKLTQIIALISFPIIIYIFVMSEEIVLVLLGDTWRGMIPILRGLILIALPQVILSLNGVVYLALGKPHIPFRLNLIIGAFQLIGFYIGLKLYGIMGLIYVYIGITLVFIYPVFYFAAKEINLKLKEQMNNLKLIIFNSLTVGAVSLLIKYLCYPELSRFMVFTISLLLSVLLYLYVTYINAKKIDSIEDIKIMITKK
jgi:PST family polysaccharide transporter